MASVKNIRRKCGINSHAFLSASSDSFVIGPETLMKVRLYRGNIDALVPDVLLSR